MGRHRFFLDSDLRPGETVIVEGEEARHAIRVRRVERGEGVEVLNGRGLAADARVEETRKVARGDWAAVLRIDAVRSIGPDSPRLEVLSGVPEGDRLEGMLDAIGQVGVARWSPLATDRGSAGARSARASNAERLARVARESAKQCGRAWLLEVGEPVAFADAGDPPACVVLADASGNPYSPGGAPPPGHPIRLLIGPEGGWSAPELTLARDRGWVIASFGPHVMRIETAAVASAAVIRQSHRSPDPPGR